MLWLEILKAILFGIVEGICEWLPISSTGHLILLNEFLTLDVSDAFYEMFEVVIQLGAILAVAVLFFDRLNPFDRAKSRGQKRETLSLWLKVVFAVIPSAVVGILLDDWFNERFYNYLTVALMLILYGVAFIIIEGFNEKRGALRERNFEVGYRAALFIGAFQVLSMIPGTSRSGATILGGMLLGLSRARVAEFSFFMAVPTMLGASLLKTVKFFIGGYAVSSYEWVILAVGATVAFVSSMLVIKYLMDFVKRHTFSAFGVYRIILGTAVLLYFIFAG